MQVGAAIVATRGVVGESPAAEVGMNGETLPVKNGFPARIIVPALPGVHCTKWVTRLEFQGVRA